eukprot:1159868-Pelagomonas_calceolata.AAC.9
MQACVALPDVASLFHPLFFLPCCYYYCCCLIPLHANPVKGNSSGTSFSPFFLTARALGTEEALLLKGCVTLGSKEAGLTAVQTISFFK